MIDVDGKTPKTYEEGLRDAWKVAGQIIMNPADGGISLEELENIFGTSQPADIFKWFAFQEIATKIAKWEYEIHINDRVKGVHGKIGVVTNANCPEYLDRACVLWEDGTFSTTQKEWLTKTGHTVDVQSILNQLSER